MLGPNVQAPLDDDPTRVDAPCFHGVARRAAGRSVQRESIPDAVCQEAPLGVRGDPGNRLAAATLAAVRCREAIATRNYRIEMAESRAARPLRPALVAIDFVRSRDPGVRIRRESKDRVTVAGRATRASAASVAIDGEIFTVRLEIGDRPDRMAARLRTRLKHRYSVEIIEELEHSITVRIDAPILLAAG
jgi:hypothetical protein